MKIEKIKIDQVKPNQNNPRIIKDEKFRKLVTSIKEFPAMLEIRPIVVNEDMIVLGGNMRLRACIEAGLSEVYIIRANQLSEQQQREFIIKDNVGFGDWNWDDLANDWDSEQLAEWGLDIWNPSGDIKLDDFFEENNEIKESKNKIVLEYTDEEFELVNEAFKKHSGSKENIVFNLLGLC